MSNRVLHCTSKQFQFPYLLDSNYPRPVQLCTLLICLVNSFLLVLDHKGGSNMHLREGGMYIYQSTPRNIHEIFMNTTARPSNLTYLAMV